MDPHLLHDADAIKWILGVFYALFFKRNAPLRQGLAAIAFCIWWLRLSNQIQKLKQKARCDSSRPNINTMRIL